jgi:hypothetical protein
MRFMKILTTVIAVALVALIATPADAQRLRLCHVQEFPTAAEHNPAQHGGCNMAFALDIDMLRMSSGIDLAGTLRFANDEAILNAQRHQQ